MPSLWMRSVVRGSANTEAISLEHLFLTRGGLGWATMAGGGIAKRGPREFMVIAKHVRHRRIQTPVCGVDLFLSGRVEMTRCMALALVVTHALSGVPTLAMAIPLQLEQFIADHPEYRLLTVADAGAWRSDFEQNIYRFAPFEVADANKDGLKDIVGVLVREGRVKTFSVICFNNSANGYGAEPLWVTKDGPQRVISVEVGPGFISPISCYECDANPPFWWTGLEYEFFLKGDRIYLRHGAEVYESPQLGSSPLYQSEGEGSAEVRILDYGPFIENRPGRRSRWYKVVVQRAGKEVVGYVGSGFYKPVGP